jgi:hypothetical protein
MTKRDDAKERGDEALEWSWERAITALKRLHDSPERWGWRYTMHALGLAANQTARLEELAESAERVRRRGGLRAVPGGRAK